MKILFQSVFIMFGLAIAAHAAVKNEELLDLNPADSAQDTTKRAADRPSAKPPSNGAVKREKGMFIGLSIEPQIQSTRFGSSINSYPPDYLPWESYFSVCIGIRPAYSFSDKFNIGLSFDNFFQRPYTVLMMQTYFGLGASLTFSRAVPVFMNADFGYSFWYYPGNDMMNSLWGSNGWGYSLSLGYPVSRRFAVAVRFYNSYPQRQDRVPWVDADGYSIVSEDAKVLIQNKAFGIRLIYKVKRPG